MLTVQTTPHNLVTTYVSFVVRDTKGRELGTDLLTYEVDFVPAPPDASWGYERAPGHYFAFRPHATRNRQPYGASPPTRYFATAARRDIADSRFNDSTESRRPSWQRSVSPHDRGRKSPQVRTPDDVWPAGVVRGHSKIMQAGKQIFKPK